MLVKSCRISIYFNNLDLLLPKPKITFRNLKERVQEFHRQFVITPAENVVNVVIV